QMTIALARAKGSQRSIFRHGGDQRIKHVKGGDSVNMHVADMTPHFLSFRHGEMFRLPFATFFFLPA
ncbi:MAG TPA: hypothetical protein VM639_06670, partial [Dongiaceae bacterium]|nr:hypothetical protein [Dongiaceae bacterium]